MPNHLSFLVYLFVFILSLDNIKMLNKLLYATNLWFKIQKSEKKKASNFVDRTQPLDMEGTLVPIKISPTTKLNRFSYNFN
jgi:hypothetical protein